MRKKQFFGEVMALLDGEVIAPYGEVLALDGEVMALDGEITCSGW